MKRREPPPITDEERRLFRQAVGDVRPLKWQGGGPDRPTPPPRPLQLKADEERVLEELLSDQWEPAELETGDELSFFRPGLQRKVMRKLRLGQYRRCAELDLHGLTVERARGELVRFLMECRFRHHDCVKIIHGKGKGSAHRGPVLKKMVNRWLQQRDEVLAFCSAQPRDGGTGAIYVLLKRSY